MFTMLRGGYFANLPLAFLFITLLSKSVEAQAEAKTASPESSLSVLADQEFEVVRQFFNYSSAIPLEHRIVERKQEGDTVREKVVFRSTQSFLVSGYLEYHVSTATPRPCVLLLHGWSGSKESWYKTNNYISGGNIRLALLNKGFAIFALDAQCHGDRIAENDFAPINHYIDEENENPRRGYFTQREVYMQTVLDYRRGLDYLKTRDEIDTTRIGAIGYSMGGTESVMLTAVDSRVKVTVACAVPFDNKRLSLIAPQNYAARIRSGNTLMITGKTDSMCTQTQTRQIHSQIPATGSKLLFVDGGHRMSTDYVPHAITWISDHL